MSLKISAKINPRKLDRIAQGDIFSDIEIIENISIEAGDILIDRITFPYVICLNQECDLETDYKETCLKETKLIHLLVAPVFNFEHFLQGKHWGDVYPSSLTYKRTDTKTKLIIDNEIPRYHYLKFPESNMPELIVDFKHYFTISRTVLYNKIDKRLCSLDDLFKEKLSQRFSFYLSRIGLPEFP